MIKLISAVLPILPIISLLAKEAIAYPKLPVKNGQIIVKEIVEKTRSKYYVADVSNKYRTITVPREGTDESDLTLSRLNSRQILIKVGSGSRFSDCQGQPERQRENDSCSYDAIIHVVKK